MWQSPVPAKAGMTRQGQGSALGADNRTFAIQIFAGMTNAELIGYPKGKFFCEKKLMQAELHLPGRRLPTAA